MSTFLRAGLFIFMLGLATALVLHVLAMTGHPVPGVLLAALIVGAIFLAFIGTAIRIKVQTDEGDWTTSGWGTLYEGVPTWARLACAVAIANVIFAARGGHAVPATAILLCLYAISGAILYSAYRQPWLLSKAFCSNGHSVKYFNRFCPVCGALLPRRTEGT